MKNKVCTKCGKKYPAILEYFASDKRHKDGLQSQCRKCCNETNRECGKKYRKTQRGKDVHKQAKEKYRQSEKGKKCEKEYRWKYYKTINGYLRNVYSNIKRRCNNPQCKVYKDYGGRGIKCLFKSSNEFVDYVVNTLGHDTCDKIEGLQIDRIDNDGNYEPRNIRFVTPSENNKNKRKNIIC